MPPVLRSQRSPTVIDLTSSPSSMGRGRRVLRSSTRAVTLPSSLTLSSRTARRNGGISTSGTTTVTTSGRVSRLPRNGAAAEIASRSRSRSTASVAAAAASSSSSSVAPSTRGRRSGRRKRAEDEDDEDGTVAVTTSTPSPRRKRARRAGGGRKKKEPSSPAAEASPPPPPCSICLEVPSRNNIARINGCDHLHCFDCIGTWSETENTCPQCKARFQRIERVNASPPQRRTRSGRGRGSSSGSSSSSSVRDVSERNQRPDEIRDPEAALRSIFASMEAHGSLPPFLASLVFSSLNANGMLPNVSRRVVFGADGPGQRSSIQIRRAAGGQPGNGPRAGSMEFILENLDD